MFSVGAVEVLNKIRQETKTSVKQKILKDLVKSDWSDISNILYYTYNQFYMYGFSQSKLIEGMEKYSETIDESELMRLSGQYADNVFGVDQYDNENIFIDFIQMCKELAESNINDDLRIKVYRTILTLKPLEREVLIGCLTKDLRLGMNVKSINKAIPNLIPTFDVQLAYPYDKFPLEEGELFYVTKKMNGYRAIYSNGKLYTKKGHVIRGSEELSSVIEGTYGGRLNHDGFNLALDGELVLIDSLLTNDDNEDFRNAGKAVKNGDFSKLKYVIFDAFSTTDRYQETYGSRLSMLNELIHKSNHISMVDLYYVGYNINILEELMDKYVRPFKYEGLMVNRDVPYTRKRHAGIVKYKDFFNMDLEIIGVESGEGRLAGTMGALIVDYKGNPLNIGSGFTDEERLFFWRDRFNMIGRVIEVKYVGGSKNSKTDNESLQFATYVCLREHGKEVNYELEAD